MSRVLSTVATLAILLPGLAEARLSETVAQIETRFGPPVHTWSAKFGEQDRRYRWKQYRVLVTFFAGKSVCERYWHDDLDVPFSDAEVQSLLAENSLGNTWERPLREPMWYMVMRGKKERIAAAAYDAGLPSARHPRAQHPAFEVITAVYARRHKIF